MLMSAVKDDAICTVEDRLHNTLAVDAGIV